MVDIENLTPPFKLVVHMIQLLISCTKDFTKETLLGRLEAVENELRQSRELTKIEIAFSGLNIRPNLSRTTSAKGDFSSSNRSKKDGNIV